MKIFSITSIVTIFSALMLLSASANATIIGYNLYAGPITNAGFGVNVGDTVAAMVEVDNTLEDDAALVSFMMDVGGEIWTEADVAQVFNISFNAGELLDLNIGFEIPTIGTMRWATNNTWNLIGANGFTFCNTCVTYEVKTAQVPESQSFALVMLGLLAFRLSRKQQRS